MEIALVLVLTVAAAAMVIVWAFCFVLTKLVKAALWGLSLPLRPKPKHAMPTLQITSRRSASERRCANPRCSADMPPEARFCGRCGSATTATSVLAHEPLPDATYVVKKWKKKGRKGNWRMVADVSTRPTVIPPRRCKVSRVA